MFIFMENLQWISQEISFSSTFQLRAICSLGICSYYNQLCDGCIAIFQWEVQHCPPAVRGEELKTCCLSGKITTHYWIEGCPWPHWLVSSPSHFRVTSSLLCLLLPCSFLMKGFVHSACPFFHIQCCLVAANVSPTYVYSCKSLESGPSINSRLFT